MEFICTNGECKHIFRPHRFIGLRHPNRAKCPKCDTRGIMTPKGKEVFKDHHKYINQSLARQKQ